MIFFLSIFLGVPLHHRAWCALCPMGTLQGALGKLGAGGKGPAGSGRS
ncbi:MAG: 4Fe-4S binding protein [Candidatus Aureabacteria bacterium]|nr:4Fe-4S binding protein [Candidatus Auribacterota bacterium]